MIGPVVWGGAGGRTRRPKIYSQRNSRGTLIAARQCAAITWRTSRLSTSADRPRRARRRWYRSCRSCSDRCSCLRTRRCRRWCSAGRCRSRSDKSFRSLFRCTPFRREPWGWNTFRCACRMFRRRGTGRSPCTPPDWNPCTCLLGTCRSGCTCPCPMASTSRRRCPGDLSIARSRDRRCPPCDRRRSPRTSPDWNSRTCPLGTCTSESICSCPCTDRLRSPGDSNRCRCSSRMSPCRGRRRSPCTPPDWNPCTCPLGTCTSDCTCSCPADTARLRSPRDSSMSQCRDRRCRRRDTRRSPCT